MTLKPTNFFTLLILYLAFLGCENESPENIAEVRCTIAAKSLEALTGNLIFERGYVHLNKVEVSGTKNGVAMNTSTSFIDPEQFFFIGDDPRQPIKVPIAEAVYGNAEVSLYFFRDPYVLQIKDTTYLDPANPSDEGNSDNDDDGDEDEADDDEETDEPADDNEDDEDEDADEDNSDEESDDDDNNDDEESDDDNDNDNEGEDDDDNGGRKSTQKGKTVNLADFMDHASPPIVLLGNFKSPEANIKVLVAIDIATLRLKPGQGVSDSLVVRKTNEISAQATFQPGLWFGAITKSEILNASLINFRGETVLFIHKDFNTALHAKIASAIEASTELNFQGNSGR